MQKLIYAGGKSTVYHIKIQVREDENKAYNRERHIPQLFSTRVMFGATSRAFRFSFVVLFSAFKTAAHTHIIIHI